MPKSGTPRGGSRSPTDIDRAVGDNVRRARIARDQTLSELAAEIGISHQQLQKYETGSNRLSAGMVARIAEILGVPLESLFRVESAPPGAGRSAKAEKMETLRQTGTYILARATSEEALRQMVDVLRVLSAKS